MKKAADKWAAKQKPQWGDEKWQRDLDEFGGLGYDIVQDIVDDLDRKHQKSEDNKKSIFYESKLIHKLDDSLFWALDNKLPVGWVEVSPDVWDGLQLSPNFVRLDSTMANYRGFVIYRVNEGKELCSLHPGDEAPPGFQLQKQ